MARDWPVNESAAGQVLLVRALENVQAGDETLTDEDRGYAGRAAAELVRWQAAQEGERPTAEAYVAKRAQLLVARFAERSPVVHRAVAAIRWRPWVGVALPLAALAVGVAAEHIADRGRVNILAFPLLGIIGWNVVVFLALAARWVRGFIAPQRRGLAWTRRLVAGMHAGPDRRASGPLAAALASFSLDWAQRAAPLVAARAARVLHLSAALLAAGAMAGLYARGLAFEYRAGWESTFLDAASVHAVLRFFLWPAAWLAGEAFPTVEQVAALQWAGGGTGENAARWIHLYALTVAVVVIVPRVVLMAAARMREQEFSARFPLALDEPGFRRVLAGWRESPAHVRVMAYAYTPAEAASAGLRDLAARLFGRDVQVHAAPTVAYGEEDEFAASAVAQPKAPDLVIALFSLASTPETENHGVFLEALARREKSPVVAMVDESPYRQRLGGQAGAAARLAERRQSWSAFAQSHGLHAVFGELAGGDLAAAERELDLQLSAAGALA